MLYMDRCVTAALKVVHRGLGGDYGDREAVAIYMSRENPD